MGTIKKKYFYESDDPYKILAHFVVSYYRPADVLRMLSDNEYIKSCLYKEVRQSDIDGYFINCAIEDILDDKARMEYMHQLDKLGAYYYSRFDRERFREEVRKYLREIGALGN